MTDHNRTFTGFREEMGEVRHTENLIGNCEVAYSRAFVGVDTLNPLANTCFCQSRSHIGTRIDSVMTW